MRAQVEVFVSKISGKGLRATLNITKGATIIRMSGKRTSEAKIDTLLEQKKLRRDNPLQIGPHMYMILDEVPVAVNHSCDPNSAVVGIHTLVAVKNIKVGVEITFDYSCTVGRENEGWLMRCHCGAKNCRQKIGAWTTLPARTLERYKRLRMLPKFVLRETQY